MAIPNPVDIGSTTLNSSSTDTVAITLTTTVAIGDLIVVFLMNDGGANLPSGVVDSQGHTYTPDVTGVRSADDYSIRQFSTVCTSAMTTSDTITGTVAGGGGTWDKKIAAVKVTPDSGRTWGAARVDQQTQATGTSTSPDSGALATTTDADAAIIGCMGAGGAPTATGGGPLTAATNSNTRVHNINGNFIDLGSVYRIVTSTGAYQSSGTWQQSDDWGCVSVAYKQESVGGGGTGIPMLVMAPPIPT